MTDFSINAFGRLTNKLGNEVKIDLNEIQKFDSDGDNRISQEELDNYIKSLNDDFDSTEINKLFRALDKDSSAEVDFYEFAVYDQKVLMQEAANLKIAEVAADSRLSSHAAKIRDELKSFIDLFANSYNANVNEMADKFKDALNTKFNEIKSGIIANDPQTIQDKVLEAFNFSLLNDSATRAGLDNTEINDNARRSIMALLESEADKFRVSYNGNNFEADLKAHLEEFLKSADATKMSSAVNTLNAKLEQYGDYISASEFSSLKEDVTQFLYEAISQGVTINLGGTNVKSEAGIKSALTKFTSGEELIAAIKDAINKLSSESIVDAAVNAAKAKAEADAVNKFASISGEFYKVNASLIDFSKVDSRYFTKESIHQRGKGWSGSRDKAYEEGYNLLTGDGLKNQIKAQIENMLKENGVPFDKIEQVFENIYNQTAQDVLNAEEMITGRGARGLSSKGHAYINVKDLCDTFINKFNENISNAVNEMNASQVDFDTVDLDLSSEVLNKTEDEAGNKTDIKDDKGNVVEDDFALAYAKGTKLSKINKTADYYKNIAEQIIDGLKSQMIFKSRNMCKANGVKFDNAVFTTMFNNSKAIAVESSTEIRFNLTIINTINTLNTKKLIDTFTQTFKKSYSNWVDEEKTKQK